MYAQFRRRVGAVVVGVALGVAALPAGAQEVITYGSLPDPGYDAVVWAIENGKVTDPSVTIKVERVSSIPALMQAAMTAQFNMIPNGVLAIPQMRESVMRGQALAFLWNQRLGPTSQPTRGITTAATSAPMGTRRMRPRQSWLRVKAGTTVPMLTRGELISMRCSKRMCQA